jgi:hypothetical protein
VGNSTMIHLLLASRRKYPHHAFITAVNHIPT